MNNPRPVMSIRKTVQLMVILTILAWATQTLFAQWGYGGLILPGRASSSSSSSSSTPPAPALPFGSAPPAAPAPVMIDRFNGGAMVELQPRARFAAEVDREITLRDVCKWSAHDAAVMEPLADTLIAKLGSGGPRVRQITVDDIKSRLHDAGANLSSLQFTGSARCAILIGDIDEREAEAQLPPVGEAPTAEQPQQPPAAEAPPTPPVFHEEQLVLTRPLSRGQRIIASDIAVKRVQLDAPTTRPAIAKEEIIGNIASRDLKPGEVFDAADISQPAIVTKGQFVTVAMRIGQFEIETVARAMDSAARGETIRAKNEANGDVYRVVITGANEGRVAQDNTDNTDSNDDVAAVSPN